MKPMRSIVLSDDEVRLIRAGKKTQLRRPVTFSKRIFNEYGRGPQEAYGVNNSTKGELGWATFLVAGDHGYTDWIRCPLGCTGETVRVKECWGVANDFPDPDPFAVMYRAGGPHMQVAAKYQEAASMVDYHFGEQWRPSTIMPDWASRLHLRVTHARAERIQDISHDDALADGLDTANLGINWEIREQSAVVPFRRKWEAQYPESWTHNDYVWAVTFELEPLKELR